MLAPCRLLNTLCSRDSTGSVVRQVVARVAGDTGLIRVLWPDRAWMETATAVLNPFASIALRFMASVTSSLRSTPRQRGTPDRN